MMYDVLVIGGGPAGISAALYLRARGKHCLILGNEVAENALAKAKAVENYAGFGGISGAELLHKMKEDADRAEVPFVVGRVLSVAKMGDRFLAATEQEMFEGKRVILALGVVGGKPLEQERELLGHGVSYCVTCDGMLYRGRHTVVCGDAPNLAEEAELLHQMGAKVTVVAKQPLSLSQDIPQILAKTVRLVAENGRLQAVEADGERVSCEGVFILRPRIAPDTLVNGLHTENGYIVVDRCMRTNIEGVYAAGDCTGKPLQVAKAVGEGVIAAAAAIGEVE